MIHLLKPFIEDWLARPGRSAARSDDAHAASHLYPADEVRLRPRPGAARDARGIGSYVCRSASCSPFCSVRWRSCRSCMPIGIWPSCASPSRAPSRSSPATRAFSGPPRKPVAAGALFRRPSRASARNRVSPTSRAAAMPPSSCACRHRGAVCSGPVASHCSRAIRSASSSPGRQSNWRRPASSTATRTTPLPRPARPATGSSGPPAQATRISPDSNPISRAIRRGASRGRPCVRAIRSSPSSSRGRPLMRCGSTGTTSPPSVGVEARLSGSQSWVLQADRGRGRFGLRLPVGVSRRAGERA